MNLGHAFRRITQYVVVALALLCAFLAIWVFFCGVVEGDPGSWSVFLGFAVGCIFLLYISFHCGLSDVFHSTRSYIAEAFRYGGKQMLCDIIKWTIIIIIAAVVFGITYRIATNSSSPPPQRGAL